MAEGLGTRKEVVARGLGEPGTLDCSVGTTDPCVRDGWNPPMMMFDPGTPVEPVAWSIYPGKVCKEEPYIKIYPAVAPITGDTDSRPQYPPSPNTPHVPAATIGMVTQENPVTGLGQFDRYMRAGANQLQIQYEAGRIKGAEYSAAFIQMQEGMMREANGFILGKYQADVQAQLVAAQIAEMYKDGDAKRGLLAAQVLETEMKTRLLAAQIHKTANETKFIATQDDEMRKNGAFDRAVTFRTSNKLIAETDYICVQSKEHEATEAFNRVKTYHESKAIATETVFTATKEEKFKHREGIEQALVMQQYFHEQAKLSLTCASEDELVMNGCAERTLKYTQESELKLNGVTERTLKDIQGSELKLNGTSKRTLETAQVGVAGEQVTLYAKQGVGFENKSKNDTFGHMINAWTVQHVEMNPDAAASNACGRLNVGNFDTTILTMEERMKI